MNSALGGALSEARENAVKFQKLGPSLSLLLDVLRPGRLGSSFGSLLVGTALLVACAAEAKLPVKLEEAPEPSRAQIEAWSSRYRAYPAGGISMDCVPPADAASGAAVLECALTALGLNGIDRAELTSWIFTFRMESPAETYRFEFSDLRHWAETEVVAAGVPAQLGKYGFVVVSCSASAGWCAMAWTLHGEPFAIARGLLDPRCVPSDPEGNYYARFSVLHSGVWSFNGGASWCLDPDLPRRFLASFNGCWTDSLAEAKFMGPKYRGRLFVDEPDADFERLECVPLADWEEPVWRLQVQAEAKER